MSSRASSDAARLARPSALLFVMLAAATPAAAQTKRDSAPTPPGAGAQIAQAAQSQMSGDPFMRREHIALTPERPYSSADSARAADVASTLRRALERYRDVEVAKRDGYQIFAPDVPGQRVYHFTHYAYAMANEGSFDASKPTSLLYRKSGKNGWALEGAMYTAHAELPLEELDKRVPLSVARWHKHVNFCLPPWGGRERWRETRNGKPVFGPSGVASEAECDAVGGRFFAEVLGWMLHAMPFGSDDPRIVFGGHSSGKHEH